VNSCMMTTDYEAAGIEIMNLTSGEITTAVQEFWHRSSGSGTEAQEDQQRQAAYRNIFLEWSEFSKGNVWLHPDARVGTAWLRAVPLR